MLRHISSCLLTQPIALKVINCSMIGVVLSNIYKKILQSFDITNVYITISESNVMIIFAGQMKLDIANI